MFSAVRFFSRTGIRCSWRNVVPSKLRSTVLSRRLTTKAGCKSRSTSRSFLAQFDGSSTNGRHPKNALWAFLGLSVFKKQDEEEEEDPLIILLKYAKLYQLRQDLPLSSDYYHKALSLLQEREQSGEWTEEQILEGKVYIYAHMGNVAFAMFKLDEAEKLYKDTMKGLLQQNKEKDDNAIIEISLKLAKIYTLENRFEEATEGYLFCMDRMEKKLKNVDRSTVRGDDPDDESGNLNTLALLGMCTTSYGRYMLMRRDYNEADRVLNEALTIAKQVFGEEDNQVAVIYSDLATVASHKNDPALARDRIQAAVRIGQAVESEDLTMFLCNLCFICSDLEDWQGGRKAAKKALRLARNNEDKHLEQTALDCLKEMKQKVNQKKMKKD